MATFHPKEVFQKAREAERQGKNKDAAAHYASLSVYLRRRGKDAEAFTLIRRAIGLDPRMVRFHLQLAVCAEVNGDLAAADAAIEYFTEKVIEKGKSESQAPVVEKVLEDHPRLKKLFFDKVLKLDRTTSLPFIGRAKSLRELGDVDGAVRELVDAISAGTDQKVVMGELGIALGQWGKPEALAHFERFSQGKISKENFLVLLRGLTRPTEAAGGSSVGPLLEEKSLRSLIEDLEREIGTQIETPEKEIEPLLEEFRRRSQPILGKDAGARMDMALAFFEMGLHTEALEELAQVEETDRRFGEAQALVGEIHIFTGSYLAALDAFQRCLRIPERTSEVEQEARYKLVQVFYKLGDLQNAFSAAAELEKQAPNYRDLRQLKHQIQEAMGSWGRAQS